MVFSQKYKLLIVDDSAFMRKLISDFFSNHPKVEVIGTARNGKDAIQKIKKLSPDVVTLDVEMPELNGLEALKEIMQVCPVPVVMLSSTTKAGAENTLIAMELGAVDFVAKPSGNISLDLHIIKDEIIEKVVQAAQVPVAKLNKPNVQHRLQVDIPKRFHEAHNTDVDNPLTKEMPLVVGKHKLNWTSFSKKIVLIGTSTGGPRALQEVIPKIPKSINAPILIVQHMPSGFTKSLAERLDHLSEIEVKEAEHGEIIHNGTAYIAPGGYHLKIKKVGAAYAIVLDQEEEPRGGHRPSVDVMFESVSEAKEFDKIACIMTGMGADGSKGLIELKNNGNVIAIAESQKTCIVYGMPKAAVETELVDEIVSLNQIAQTIMKYLP